MAVVHTTVEAAHAAISATEHFNECHENHTALECALSTGTHQISAVKTLLSGSEFVTECKANGNTTTACITGAAVSLATERITEAASVTMVVGSGAMMATPSAPLAPVVFGAGATGLVNSTHYGRAAGDLTVNVFNYLVDNVPADAIDETQEMILFNEQKTLAVQFQPVEVAFIKMLVKSNQDVNILASIVDNAEKSFTEKYSQFEQKFHANEGKFEQGINKVSMKISDISVLCESLRKTTFSRVDPAIIQKLQAPIRTDYAETQNKAIAHNHASNETHAAVYYDSRDDRWGIQFSYNVGYGGGRGGGCVLL